MKEVVENHPVIVVISTAFAAFGVGIATYEGILRISGSHVVSRSARVLSDDEKAMPRTEYDKLISASTELLHSQAQSSELSERVIQFQLQHEFLIRYLRYEATRQILEEEFSEENRENHELAEKMFVDLILKWWKQQQEFDGTLVLNQQVIRKSLDPTNSRVEFPDGTRWAIPTNIKKKVLDQE